LPARSRGQPIVAVTGAVGHHIIVELVEMGARGRFEPIRHVEIADKKRSAKVKEHQSYRQDIRQSI
jgi:hypothetical protein